MSKESDFLNELADLLEKYNVEIENNYHSISCCNYESFIDFDFQDLPYSTLHFTNCYITHRDFRERAKEYNNE